MNHNVLNYIQFGLIFINGFLISRVLIKCGIAEKIVFFFIKKSKGHISRLIIYLVYTSSILSMFIPNVITVLAILPIIDILRKDLLPVDKKGAPLNTSFALANLYGANIGGTGSVTGSFSNTILLGFLILKGVKGSNKIDFISWLGWGIPLVIIFSAIACLMLIFFMVPRDLRKRKINFTSYHEHKEVYPHQKRGIIISIVTFFFWIVLSSINLIDKKIILPYSTVIAITYLFVFCVVIFLIKQRDIKTNTRSRILLIKDCFSNLPIKGFIIAICTVILSGILIYYKVDKELGKVIHSIIPSGTSVLVIMLILSSATVFISEFVSNTATAVSFFFIAISVFNSQSVVILPILIGISLASTVVFMGPLASPVNALAFGGVKGVNLRKMITLGFFMNLIGIIIMSLLAVYFFPHYYKV